MTGSAPARTGLHRLTPVDPASHDLNVIVETPRGHRNKYRYDEEHGLFKLDGLLPAGAVFPYDFGFVPATLGDDGDPLDVLVLMEEPAFVGCLVPSRLIGVIEAEQTERDGHTERNDRLIAVARTSRLYEDVRSLEDLGDHLVDEIEHFFVSYNAIKGKQFKPLGRANVERARTLLDHGAESFARQAGGSPPPRGAAGSKAAAD